ncbi:hypothetical protein BD324DRAFT_28118 [Kockovaella imperatae]|uniref:GS catalytic domain-containing protein n=1 Tax=Kockovaella imperatae TaxID=4999 RepID=A0A1Y1UTR1_9TREE|nr:hypothetical protein BD324DRAFT_28118 [Kockovaella imperatae]ORX40914.1 hypothetical protein BD324DRAFT_28118 [Kockovaella imperatae]
MYTMSLFKQFLDLHPEVQHIRVDFAAYDNFKYSKGITARHARALGQSGGVSVPGPICFGQTRYTQLLYEAIKDQETNHLVPDQTTLRLSIDPKVAMVQCFVTSPNALRDENDLWAACPRKLLQRVNDRADKNGLGIKVGWEIEFLLLASSDATAPLPTPLASFSTAGMEDPSFKVVYDTVEHLEANRVPVWTYHAECSPPHGGGFEITLSPSSPLESADNLLYSMSIIRQVAQKHGYHATCHPKPFEAGPGTGQHIHMSIAGHDLADSFLAGVMARLNQTTAFLLGGYDSYSRQGAYGGGWIYHSPGKIPPVRDCGTAHWEFRMPDNLCNPYLQLAAIICTGLEGIDQQLSPPSARTIDEMMGMSADQAAEQGIKALPKSLKAAIDELEANQDWWAGQFSKTSIKGYLMNSRAEISQSDKMAYAKRVQLAMNHG